MLDLLHTGGATNITEGSTTDTIDLTLTKDAGDALPTANVDVTLTPDADVDLGGGSGVAQVFTFVAGDFTGNTATKSITVTAVNDADIETAHTGIITSSDTSSTDGTYDMISPSGSPLTANITDNDTAAVSISGGTTTVSEGGSSANLQVTLDLTANGVANKGTLQTTVTADLPGNFDYSTTAASFGVGAKDGDTDNISVSATNDRFVEGKETFASQSLIATPGSVVASGSEKIVVNDNETAKISFSSGSSKADEGKAAHNVSAQLAIVSDGTGPIELKQSVTVDVTDAGSGSASGKGTDYTATKKTLIFSPGDGDKSTKSTTGLLAIVSDRLVEGDETLNLDLTLDKDETSGAVTVDGKQNSHEVTITDDDMASIVFSNGKASIAEDTKSTTAEVKVVVSASGKVGGDGVEQTIELQVNDTGGGKATKGGVDYDYTDTKLSFAPFSGSESKQNVNVSIIEDILVEGDEDIELTLEKLADDFDGQVSIGATKSHTLTILDDDISGTRTFDLVNSGGHKIVRNGGNVELYEGGKLIASEAIGAFALIINGTSGDDKLTIDYAGGNPFPDKGITFNGGANAGGGDEAEIVDTGGFTTVNYTANGTGAGSLTLDGDILSYTGLEPMTLMAPVTDVTIDIDPGNLYSGKVTTTVSSDGTDTTVDFDLASGLEDIKFNDPSGSLTINGDANDEDVINLQDLGTDYVDLTVSAQAADTIDIQNAIDLDTNEKLSLTAGTIDIGANVTTDGGSQTFTGSVDLTVSPTLAAGAGDVTFAGTVDGGKDLTVNTTGTTEFQNAVGGSTALTKLTTNAGGSTKVGGDITTLGGAITFNDDVTLTADSHMNAGTNVIFGGKVDGDFTLETTTSGTGEYTGFGGVVGGGTALSKIEVNGEAQVSANMTAQGGTMIFNGLFLLTTDVSLTDTGKTGIEFKGAVRSLANAAAPHSLTVKTTDAASTIEFEQPIGNNSQPLDQLTITNAGEFKTLAAADALLEGAFLQDGAGSNSIGGDITTTGDDITFSTDVTLTANHSLSTGNLVGGTIEYKGKIDDDGAASNRDLGLDAGTGDVKIGDKVGDTQPPNKIVILQADNVTFSKTVKTADELRQNGGTGTTKLNGGDIGGKLDITTVTADLTGTLDVGTAVSSVTSQIVASRNIVLNSGTILRTSDDPLNLSANQQAIATTGTFVGIEANNADVITTGDGALSMKGGGTGDNNYGVYIHSGGTVDSQDTGASTGTITITGTGGNGASSNYGVYVTGSTSEITSVDGDIKIDGQGGNGSSSLNRGVYISSADIKSSGTGSDAATITITGTGGNGAASNHGVDVAKSSSEITSVDGAIKIDGQGGNGSGSANRGVYITSADIKSSGTGAGAGTVLFRQARHRQGQHGQRLFL
ncbi:MAG: Calx-beta domain-containing protein [Pirellulaceae bacterium]|nr:Calx-beta domain-containing protein [Pirellulaceae bacterium]